jgi:hypothetical protein
MNSTNPSVQPAHRLKRLLRLKSAACLLIGLTMGAFAPTVDLHAEKAAVRAPVDCRSRSLLATPVSCGKDLTITEARTSWAEYQSRLKQSPPNEKSSPDEENNELRHYLALLREQKLVPKLESHSCRASSTRGYILAKIDDVESGHKEFNKLFAHAISGAPFTDGYGFWQVVETNTSEPSEQHLALCQVSKQGGPPRECVTVAIITPQETWLRGELSERFMGCPTSAFIRISGSIGILYNVKSSASPVLFATSVQKDLNNSQQLTTDLIKYADTNGVAYSVRLNVGVGLRDSRVLSGGWREALDFDVYFGRHDSRKDYLSVEGTLNPMVSRLAGGSLTEYQGLNDAQRNTYMTTFDKLVGNAIRASCQKAVDVNSKTIACE